MVNFSNIEKLLESYYKTLIVYDKTFNILKKLNNENEFQNEKIMIQEVKHQNGKIDYFIFEKYIK